MLLKPIVFAFVFLLSLSAAGQFKKGNKMAGASIGSVFFNAGASEVSFPAFSGYSSKTNSYGLRIEPVFGWFISDNTAVGFSLNINPSGEKTTYEDNGTTFQKDESRRFNIGMGGFVRNYFNSQGNFIPFGQAGFNFGITNAGNEGFRYYDSTPDYKISYDGKSSGGFFANALLQLGLTKMIGENVGLDLFAGYTFSYNKNTFTTTTLRDDNIDGTIETRSESNPTTRFTNHGFILGAGFQIFLR
jgi:hypothetical protein